MPYEADIVIIGAGVIGLAIAARVASETRKVYVIDKCSSNSEDGCEDGKRSIVVAKNKRKEA